MSLRNKFMQMLAGCAALILSAACSTVGTGHNGGGMNLTPSLEGTIWILKSINGKPAITISAASLRIKNGMISGSASCNQYSVRYTGDENGKFSIDTSRFILTAMACSPSEIMDQENEFIALLPKADKYSIAGNTLTLKAPDGKTAIFAQKIQ